MCAGVWAGHSLAATVQTAVQEGSTHGVAFVHGREERETFSIHKRPRANSAGARTLVMRMATAFFALICCYEVNVYRKVK